LFSFSVPSSVAVKAVTIEPKAITNKPIPVEAKAILNSFNAPVEVPVATVIAFCVAATAPCACATLLSTESNKPVFFIASFIPPL